MRVHPFVALIVAALTVALLTPEASVYRSSLDSEERAELFANGIEASVISPEGVDFEGKSPELISAHNTAVRKSKSWFVSRVADAFGEGCGNIAIIIAMAAIIGKCLLDFGAARRIVDSLMGLFGIRRTPIAFAPLPWGFRCSSTRFSIC